MKSQDIGAVIRRAIGVFRCHGLLWIISRAVLEMQKRVGWEVWRFRARSWRPDECLHWLAPSERERSPEELLADWRASAKWARMRCEAADELTALLAPAQRQCLVGRAEAILGGRFQLFFYHEVDAGFPPNWLCNPALGPAAMPSPTTHWSRIPMRGEAYGDMKYVWELSRFGWAFTLARAYAITADERFAEGFWFLWEDWIEKNPPHATVQWKCGQECALRVIAVSFAMQTFAFSRATTPARYVLSLGALATHAERIAAAGWYARLQTNNHSMSEGAGVFTVGAFFPQLAMASKWRRYGAVELECEALRLIRPDGTFVQKSHNYHRLMLHIYLWARSVGDTVGWQFSAAIEQRLEAAGKYLTAVLDHDSGRCPNFGNNDGALILPLDESAYEDFRPVVASVWAVLRGVRSHPKPGPWQEAVFWLAGPDQAAMPAIATEQRDQDVEFADGGIYLLRQKESWTMFHAERYRDRPAHADQLHVDLWWRGQNVCRDAGTFLYYGPRELFAWFSGTGIHNTMQVDQAQQMEPGPRFLWASRAQARILEKRSGVAVVAEHDGYRRLPRPVTHRRGVHALGDDTWLIWDELTGAEGPHELRLHWLLGDFPIEATAYSLQIMTPAGACFLWTAVDEGDGLKAASPSVIRAGSGLTAPGWQSRHYGDKEPAVSIEVLRRVEVSENRPTRFVTVFAASPITPATDDEGGVRCGGRLISFPRSGRWTAAQFLSSG